MKLQLANAILGGEGTARDMLARRKRGITAQCELCVCVCVCVCVLCSKQVRFVEEEDSFSQFFSRYLCLHCSDIGI